MLCQVIFCYYLVDMIDNDKYSTCLLPFPDSFKDFCIYDLDEKIPFWVRGCFKDKSYNRYINLFDNSLQLHELDNSSTYALNEFSNNIIDTDLLIQNAQVPSSNLDLDKIIHNASILRLLRNSNLYKVSDIANIGLQNLNNMKSFGSSKIIYIASKIGLHHEANKPQKNKEININENNNFIKNVIENNSDLKLIYFNDPRYINIRNNTLKLLDQNIVDDNYNWSEILIHIASTTPIPMIELIVKDLVSRIEHTKKLSLEEQMKEIFVCSIKNKGINSYTPKRLESLNHLCDRLGIKESEEDIYTLEKTASFTNPPVTRERIRQIESKTLKILDFQADNEMIYMPKLFYVYNLFKNNTLINEENLCRLIEDQGFGKWNIQRILKCFELFNFTNTFQINSGLLNTSSQKEKTSLVIKFGKKIIQQNGLVELNHLYRELIKTTQVEINFVKKVLESKFIKVSEDWFYTETGSNLLISLAQRIANFSSEFDLIDLKEAHIKYSTLRSPGFFKDQKRTFLGFLSPPTFAIAGLFKIQKDYSVENNKIICNKIDNPFVETEELADSQFLEYFKARNFECATFQEMKNYFLIEKKMREGSYFQYLTYKPYFKRYGRGIWGICGKPPSAYTLENAKNRIETSSPAKTEWCDNGVLQIKVRLPNVSSFVFSLKDEYIELINTDYFEIFHEGEVYKKVKRSPDNPFWYGLGSYLSNILHCEIGDYISILLDIPLKEIKAEIITESSYYD